MLMENFIRVEFLDFFRKQLNFYREVVLGCLKLLENFCHVQFHEQINSTFKQINFSIIILI